uniref:Uncharacterized protein n=1 Tax=Cacopsylla melanoneura TaxID=428564 RepID=A0A8D8SVN3_9HEMI
MHVAVLVVQASVPVASSNKSCVSKSSQSYSQSILGKRHSNNGGIASRAWFGCWNWSRRTSRKLLIMSYWNLLMLNATGLVVVTRIHYAYRDNGNDGTTLLIVVGRFLNGIVRGCEKEESQECKLLLLLLLM